MITYIKFKNHPVLGDAAFDFRKTDGSVYKTILLIGENGSGKTSVLASINSAINNHDLNYTETISYTMENNVFTIQKDYSENRYYEYDGPFDSLTNKRIYTQQRTQLQKQGCVFSSTRTNFELPSRNYQNEDDLDKNPHFSDERMDYSMVLNLFFNLQSLDLQEYADLNKKTLKHTFDEFDNSYSRISRFKSAFNNFFEDIKLVKIQTNNLQNIRVFFEKYGKEIEIDNLSSGEKQIVFRGTNVLRNKTIMDYGVVLIDEPELSLHPKWQSKILGFYKDIFTKGDNQTTQIFVSSHSENIIIEAFKSIEDTLILKMTSTADGIKVDKISNGSLLPTVTYAEASYLTFGVLAIEYHAQLFGYLQNRFGLTVKETDSYIVSSRFYNALIHERTNTYLHTTYYSLPAYIRNAFDHPYQNEWIYNELDIDESIKLLRSIINELV